MQFRQHKIPYSKNLFSCIVVEMLGPGIKKRVMLHIAALQAKTSITYDMMFQASQ